MIITDAAKEMLQESLLDSKNDCLQVKLQKTCCGSSLFFQMGKRAIDDQAVRVNEIDFVMDQEAAERTADVTVDCQNGQLILNDPAASDCSSCG